MSEDVSKKRLSRAMEKLRGFFSKRGVTLGAVVLLAAISENAVQAAPAGLASQIAVATTAGASVTAAALVKAALKLMTWTKIKIVGASLAIGLAVATVPVALTLSAADSGVTTPDGRDVKLERYEFKAGPVRYSLPSFGTQPVADVRNGRNGQRYFSAEFSWELRPAHPRADAMRVVVADELGNEFDPVVQDVNIQESETRQYWVAGMETFPRRGKQLYLRLLDNGHLMAEFKIPNPAAGSYPEWTAQPLPVKAMDRDVEIALTEFRSCHPDLKTNTVAQRVKLHTECAFSFRENNQPTTAWRPVMLELSDATGNRWTASPFGGSDPYGTTVENGAVRVHFFGALWPGESAWKLRGDFKRIADFRENELLHLTKIRIPNAQEVIEPRTRYDWNGASVELAGVLDGKADRHLLTMVTPSMSVEDRLNRVRLMNADRTRDAITIVLSGEILSRKRRLTFVSATDERGNPIEIKGTGEPVDVAATRNQAYWCSLRPPAGAHEINLVVAVTENRIVEFLARPEQVKE